MTAVFGALSNLLTRPPQQNPAMGGPVQDVKEDQECMLLDGLVRESNRARTERGPGQTGLSITDMAARNQARFLGDHSTTFSGGANSLLNQEGYKLPAETPTDSGVIKANLNRTQTATIATTSTLTERPVEFSVEGEELSLIHI